MRYLFVHQNFPGQYVHLAQRLAADPAHDVVALTDAKNQRPEFVRTVRYATPDMAALASAGLTRRFREHVLRAELVATAAQGLARTGFHPDVILGHFGWGETLFLKDVWPQAKLIVYAEFYYGGDDSDSGFDPEFPSRSLRVAMENRVRNASLLAALAAADRGLAPTQWQRSRFPLELRSKIDVIHDGVDTDLARPDPGARLALQRDGVVLKSGDEVVTFVSRNLEPYRGYHMFMRALPRILRERPSARALIIGGDGVSYGAPARGGRTWRDVFLAEVRSSLDLSRVHFVGRVPHPLFLKAMQVSAAHVYSTYPFVLSWSMLEAMACGALVIGSDTAPVQEAITDNHNGLLTDFFNPHALADRVIDALASPQDYYALRRRARATVVDGYDLRRTCLPQQLRFIERNL